MNARGAALRRRLDATRPGQFLHLLVREIVADDVSGMAAEMAYRFLFAVFPLLLLLVAALGFIGDALGFDDLFARLLAEVRPFLPPDVATLVEEYVTGLLETQSPAFLTVGLLGTLWGAAGGVGTLMKALDRAYDVERRPPFWKHQALALAVTAIIPPAGLLFLAVTVLGSRLTQWISEGLGLWPVASALAALGRWPVLALVMTFSLSLMYHLLPNVQHRYIWSLPGSVIATAGWLLITQLFSLYVANFGRYDVTYGSFGAVIAFMLWLYLVGVVILVGAEVNQACEVVYGGARRSRTPSPRPLPASAGEEAG